MYIKIYREITSIRDIWLELQLNGVCYIFQTIEWTEDWLNTAGKAQNVEPFVVLVSEAPQVSPSLIIPLAIRRVGGVRILMMMGGFHADYASAVMRKTCGAIYSDGLWQSIVLHAKRCNVDLIWINNLPPSLGDIPNPLLAQNCRNIGMAHSVSLTGSWTDFYGTRIKSKLRSDSRRRAKRLMEFGEMSFKVAEDKEEADRLTQIMIKQKEDWYKAMGIKDQFAESANREFYLMRNRGKATPPPHVSALSVNDNIIAVHWGEIHDGRFYHLMPSYDMEWEKYSPGRLLLEKLLEWCFSEGLDIFDFTGGGEAYKLEWANIELPLYRYERVLTLRGKLFLAVADLYRSHIRRIITSVRNKLRKR